MEMQLMTDLPIFSNEPRTQEQKEQIHGKSLLILAGLRALCEEAKSASSSLLRDVAAGNLAAGGDDNAEFDLAAVWKSTVHQRIGLFRHVTTVFVLLQLQVPVKNPGSLYTAFPVILGERDVTALDELFPTISAVQAAKCFLVLQGMTIFKDLLYNCGRFIARLEDCILIRGLNTRIQILSTSTVTNDQLDNIIGSFNAMIDERFHEAEPLLRASLEQLA